MSGFPKSESIADLSSEDRASVMGGTAMRVYALDVRAQVPWTTTTIGNAADADGSDPS